MSSPAFPPEIEYKIFLCALQKEVEGGFNLLLVAKRVHEWLLPHIYRTIICYRSRVYPPKFTASPMECVKLHGHHIQNLCIKFSFPYPDDNPNIFPYCPNVSNLAVWGDRVRSKMEAIIKMQNVNRLTIDIDYFRELEQAYTATQQIVEVKQRIGAFLSNITHLDVVDADYDGSCAHIFNYLTSITHICIPLDIPSAATIRNIVQSCPTIQVIVLFMRLDDADGGSPEYKEYSERELSELQGMNRNKSFHQYGPFTHIKDVPDIILGQGEGGMGFGKDVLKKVVPLASPYRIAAWEAGARGGQDVWSAADSIVRERLGLVNP